MTFAAFNESNTTTPGVIKYHRVVAMDQASRILSRMIQKLKVANLEYTLDEFVLDESAPKAKRAKLLENKMTYRRLIFVEARRLPHNQGYTHFVRLTIGNKCVFFAAWTPGVHGYVHIPGATSSFLRLLAGPVYRIEKKEKDGAITLVLTGDGQEDSKTESE